MKIAIVYTSVTGNTKELAGILYQIFLMKEVDISIYRIEEFQLSGLSQYDAVAVGTYTWGEGEIPQEMRPLYHAFESLGKKEMVTAVFGTGDSFYPNYCGAVERFRDMLYVHTDLAATLKVELMPQLQDFIRCQKFVDSVRIRFKMKAVNKK
nr:flavodoxin domain-containing protein [Neobacillus sp. Marseille-Q6967]